MLSHRAEVALALLAALLTVSLPIRIPWQPSWIYTLAWLPQHPPATVMRCLNCASHAEPLLALLGDTLTFTTVLPLKI